MLFFNVSNMMVSISFEDQVNIPNAGMNTGIAYALPDSVVF